jgi:hypothetical protein
MKITCIKLLYRVFVVGVRLGRLTLKEKNIFEGCLGGDAEDEYLDVRKRKQQNVFHNEKLRNLCTSPNSIRRMEPRKI